MSRTETPSIANHSVRSYLYARLVGSHRGLVAERDYDPELLFFACVLHDIGLTEDANKAESLEVDAADFAAEFSLSARVGRGAGRLGVAGDRAEHVAGDCGSTRRRLRVDPGRSHRRTRCRHDVHAGRNRRSHPQRLFGERMDATMALRARGAAHRTAGVGRRRSTSGRDRGVLGPARAAAPCAADPAGAAAGAIHRATVEDVESKRPLLGRGKASTHHPPNECRDRRAG